VGLGENGEPSNDPKDILKGSLYFLLEAIKDLQFL
jgi:hypothetical protein